MYIIYRLLIQCCMFTKIDNNLHKVFFFIFSLLAVSGLIKKIQYYTKQTTGLITREALLCEQNLYTWTYIYYFYSLSTMYCIDFYQHVRAAVQKRERVLQRQINRQLVFIYLYRLFFFYQAVERLVKKKQKKLDLKKFTLYNTICQGNIETPKCTLKMQKSFCPFPDEEVKNRVTYTAKKVYKCTICTTNYKISKARIKH